VFDLEADRLSNPAFDPKVIESERGVVYSERRLRTEDSNDGFLAEQVQATAFVAHPYQNPTSVGRRHPGLEDRRPAEVLQDQLCA
jgi:zinc protease